MPPLGLRWPWPLWRTMDSPPGNRGEPILDRSDRGLVDHNSEKSHVSVRRSTGGTGIRPPSPSRWAGRSESDASSSPDDLEGGDHLELIALAGVPSGRERHPEPLLQRSLLRRQLVGVVLCRRVFDWLRLRTDTNGSQRSTNCIRFFSVSPSRSGACERARSSSTKLGLAGD